MQGIYKDLNVYLHNTIEIGVEKANYGQLT